YRAGADWCSLKVPEQLQSEIIVPAYPQKNRLKIVRQLVVAAGCVAVTASLLDAGRALAQLGGGDPGVRVPGFWDPRRRPERPDLSRLSVIRFLTETDYPPFNYAGPDGNPAGFNVDLARLICDEIKVTCTIQMRRFDTLLGSLADNRGDAVIASIAATPVTRPPADFSDPYYRVPARFVSKREVEIDNVRPEQLEGRKVAVVAGTAHEAYLKALLPEDDR